MIRSDCDVSVQVFHLEQTLSRQVSRPRMNVDVVMSMFCRGSLGASEGGQLARGQSRHLPLTGIVIEFGKETSFFYDINFHVLDP